MPGRRKVSGARRLVVGARRHARRPAPLPSTPPLTPFPQAPLDISVAIFVDNSWIDITPFVYGQDRADIRITRGRPNEAKHVDPARASFQLNNRDGQFSPRNPTSWLYGKIGRNTQVRVAIGADMRFVGEISEWPPRWDTTGTDVYVPIEASGILRRLQQGDTPVKSPIYRGLTTLPGGLPVAYWPCEDDEGATEIASGIGGSAMRLFGTPTFQANTEYKCSAPLPTFNGSRWAGPVPGYVSTGVVQVWFLMQIPSGGSANGPSVCDVACSGTVVRWRLAYETGASGLYALKAYDLAGTELLNDVVALGMNGLVNGVSILLEQNGSDIRWTVATFGATLAGGGTEDTGTLAAQTLGVATSVTMNPAGSHTGVACGHVTVLDEILGTNNLEHPLELQDELDAYWGEPAGRRVERLCEQEGVAFRGLGNLDDTEPMGFQSTATLVDLLRECADADQGILYEPRDFLGICYRTREDLYNQAAGLELNYAAADLSGIEPTDDDQLVRNDIKAKRADGSSFRAIEETGALSVQDPPAGVGRYDEEVTLNLQWDGQLANAAGWRLHLGTVDEARYPTLALDLARARFIGANATQADAVRHLDIGDRLTVDNPPAWLPPEDITQLAQGFTEILAQFTHTIGVNCSPALPWSQVGHYDEPADRFDTNGSTLAAAVDSTATSLSVATTVGPVWTDADGSYDIMVAGERMTVTAVTGASSPQTFTVTRSVNTVVKSHTAGTAIELADPFVYVP